MTEKKISSGRAADLRRRAEELARANAAPMPETQDRLSPKAARQLLYDLRVHQIELEMQNEELRRAQEALEASRARYFDLYDLAPVGYFTLSEQGLILEANLTAAVLLGVARGALAKQPLTRFIVPEDQDIYYRHRKQLFETGAPQGCELRMLRADAPPFKAWVKATVAKDGEGGASICRTVMSDISELKRVEDELRAALQEREVMLREIHHRVKNNIQIISSLLRLQSKSANDEKIKAVLDECQDRIRSIALVHEKLYQSRNFSRIDFSGYIENLTGHLVSAYQGASSRVNLRIEADDVQLDINRAIPLGLIINELVTNALKHAFSEEKMGDLLIGLRRTEGGGCQLTVKDTGIGLSERFGQENSGTLGFQIVRDLVQQLDGTIAIVRGAGTEFIIQFPLLPSAP